MIGKNRSAEETYRTEGICGHEPLKLLLLDDEVLLNCGK
jgi:hypothetical protein